MSAQDFMYYAFGLGFLFLVSFLAYTAYELARILRSSRMMIEEFERNILVFEMLRGRFASGIFGFLANLLSKRKGGV